MSRYVGRDEGRDEGSLALLVAVMAVPLLLLVGLIFDGGRAMRARGRAVAYAEEAARSGAQGIDPLKDTLTLDPVAAAARVDDFCATAQANDPTLTTCRLDGPVGANCVVVRTGVTVSTDLLALAKIDTLTGSGSGRASAVAGVTTPVAATGCG